MLSRIKKL